jgi:hypothetical protein
MRADLALKLLEDCGLARSIVPPEKRDGADRKGAAQAIECCLLYRTEMNHGMLQVNLRVKTVTGGTD